MLNRLTASQMASLPKPVVILLTNGYGKTSGSDPGELCELLNKRLARIDEGERKARNYHLRIARSEWLRYRNGDYCAAAGEWYHLARAEEQVGMARSAWPLSREQERFATEVEAEHARASGALWGATESAS